MQQHIDRFVRITQKDDRWSDSEMRLHVDKFVSTIQKDDKKNKIETPQPVDKFVSRTLIQDVGAGVGYDCPLTSSSREP